MPDIVTNMLYQEIDRLQEKVKELEESRDSWKREWRLSNAGLDMAEKRIAELEAENHRLIVQRDGAFERWKSAIAKYPNGADGCCCLFDDNENQVQWCTPHAELRDENDALTAERDKLKARVAELEAENKRLRELVDGATEVVEISNFTFPAQREWKAAWLKKAAKAMKEASHGGR